MIVAGVWDEDIDAYVRLDTDFTVALKRSRLYHSITQTPVHHRHEKGVQAFSKRSIDDPSRRGQKVSSLT